VSTITCVGLTKSFGTTRVLDRLDLAVPDGAVVTLIGESGSGKTTLMRLVAGFERPDAGTITLDDDVVDSAQRFVPPDKRRIGFVAQEGNLFPHLTVAKNVAFGLPRAQRSSGRVRELLDLVGLGDLGGRYPHQLSGGQQQRVALARALAPRPRLVLLDEPFSSLDPALRSSLRADVMRILRDQHATTLFVTHDQAEALSAADLVGIVGDGTVRQLATPETLYNQPADAAVAKFLGDANLVDGTVDRGAEGRGVDHRLVHTALGDLHLVAGRQPFVGPATVLVRPEQVVPHRLDDTHPSDPATGRVVDRQYFGHDCMLVVSTGGGRSVRVRCGGQDTPQLGDAVALSVDGDVVAWPAPATDAGTTDAGAAPARAQARTASA